MIEIFSSSLAGLQQILTWSAFSLMLLGILIGFMVGILPGLGGATTLALMLPFVVKMNAFEAFAFLLGMAAVTNTTGDITSILFGIPGEPTTAATIVDGHPMAKKGEAGRALGAVIFSSLVGSLVGAFALAVAIPVIRPLVLSMGSPEFFMIAILGLTFVAALSGGSVLKAVITGGLGLFLSTVGTAPVSGVHRFTFGHLFLWDGIGLVPITIGFFAIPEVVELVVRGTSIAGEKVSGFGGVMEGIKDTLRHRWLVIRCSLLGTFTGILPGMGGATSQWLAYAHAVQSSEGKERFGKGAVEGVLGPGAANNAILGGHLISTLAFGVPVSVMMAILLGAFLIQGLVPGPDMLIPEPDGHLSLTFSFVWTIVISNIITVALCLLFLKQLVRITYIRSSLLIPLIVLLIYLGAFTEKNTFQDLILVFAFGLLGWIMQQVDWPRPPLILGLVLGPLAENRLFLSVDNYGLAWLTRPAVLVLILLTLTGAFYPGMKAMLRKRKRRRVEVPRSAPVPDRAGQGFNFTWDSAFTLGLVIVMVMGLLISLQFNPRAGLFPWAVGFPVGGLAVLQLVLDLRGRGAGGTGGQSETTTETMGVHPGSRRRTAGTFGWVLGYLLAIWLLGFPIGGSLCAFLQLKFSFREKWILSLILSLSAWIFIYGFFGLALHVPFPDGALLTWLDLVPE